MTVHEPKWWGCSLGRIWVQFWLTDWRSMPERQGLVPRPFTVHLGRNHRLTIIRRPR